MARVYSSLAVGRRFAEATIALYEEAGLSVCPKCVLLLLPDPRGRKSSAFSCEDFSEARETALHAFGTVEAPSTPKWYGVPVQLSSSGDASALDSLRRERLVNDIPCSLSLVSWVNRAHGCHEEEARVKSWLEL
eukprot:scaffold1343_cov217-Pinguiococcus_pyrenoidosus.AAC.7